MVDWLTQHLRWNLSIVGSENTILAIYCSTKIQREVVRAQVLESESRSTTHICKQLVRELIPSSTCFVVVFHARLYLYVIYTIRWFCNRCVDKSSTQLQLAISNHSHIYIIDRSSSYEAIVNHIVHAHTWQYRYNSWSNHLEWACK